MAAKKKVEEEIKVENPIFTDDVVEETKVEETKAKRHRRTPAEMRAAEIQKLKDELEDKKKKKEELTNRIMELPGLIKQLEKAPLPQPKPRGRAKSAKTIAREKANQLIKDGKVDELMAALEALDNKE